MTRSKRTSRAHTAPSETAKGTVSGEILFTVVAGDDALLWSNTALNRTAWDQLWAECPWSTAFQSRAFFDIWVRNYRQSWAPLLVIGLRRDGSLAGVMPLAENADLIVGAGAHQAEYQGPISSEADALMFFDGALTALARHAPHRELRLRYLPPDVPKTVVEWLGRHDRATLIPRETQHLFADGATADAAMKKSGNKSKLNRLRRTGDVQFRRLAPEVLEAEFTRLVAMYDFRQGALHDTCPFFDDDRKLPFHLDWLRNAPSQLHATGLYVDDRLISAVLLVRSKDEAHLAISAHSPAHAAYSPSKLNLYFATRSLYEEGAAVLDLTPGDDPWKARFATKVRTVWDVKVFASPWSARRRRLQMAAKNSARRLLSSVGLSVDDVRAWVQWPSHAWRARRNTVRPQTQYMFDIGSAGSSNQPASIVSANCLRDLLVVGDRLRRDARASFLANALERIERGDRCFVAFDQSRRAHCLGWLRAQGKAEVSVFDGFWISDLAHLGTAVSCLNAMVRAVAGRPSSAHAVVLNLQRDQQILRTAAALVSRERTRIDAADVVSDLSKKVINL
jgi:CelD/BcsL family acetyltransferase involved in cellulose biosynthesis